MEQEHIQYLLPEYLDGQLESSEEKKVEAHLEVCEACSLELQNLEALFEAFKNEKEIEPSPSVREGFSKMLEHEKKKISEDYKVIPINSGKRNKAIRKIFKIAAVGLLLFCSYLLGKYNQTSNPVNPITNNSEIESQENEMLALFEDTSASKRIQGVSYFEEYENPDEDIIDALTERMLYDENKNVRLAAVEALEKFTKSETVKQNFISALKSEKDPVIQIAIIQILVKIQEKKAITPLKQLLKQDSTEPFVKDQIEALLPSIT